MRLATWNVNSIRAREGPVVDWLADQLPDVCCLQETKCTDAAFPAEAFESLGASRSTGWRGSGPVLPTTLPLWWS